MNRLFDFLTMVYQGPQGGWGLLIAFGAVCSVVATIGVEVAKCFRRRNVPSA